MRRIILLVILIFFGSNYAHASCGGGLYGSSNKGSFYIGAGDCEYKQEMIVFTDLSNNKKLFVFNRECEYIKDKDGAEIGFSCRPKGKSPLAGATYRHRVEPKKKGACDAPPLEYYACVKGCSASTPRVFDIEPVECDG